MKNLLFVIMFLFLVSCNDQGAAYKNPQKELSAEIYNKIDSGESALAYIEDKYMYVKTKKGIYKTVVISESDLTTGVLGGDLLLFIICFLLGLLCCFLTRL